MSTDFISFQPNENGAPPFQFKTSIAEGLITVSITWNLAAERWYMRVQNSAGVTYLYRPLIASPAGYDINLISTISRSSIVYREKNTAFEVMR